MKHFAAQGVVLDFLDEGEALGPGVAVDVEVNEEVFGDGVADEFFPVQLGDFEMRPLARSFFTSPWRVCVRRDAFKFTVFMF
jgi:hypothetical protein